MRSSNKLDRDLLHSISPFSLAAYLRSHGWSGEDFEGGSIWTTAVEGGGPGVQLVVPKSQSMRSYASAVGDVVGLLAEAENRPEWMVIRAVKSSLMDVQYITTHPEVESGFTPLGDGVSAFDSAKQWVLSAAVSVASAKKAVVQPVRKPPKALDFVRTVMLGATYPGSFTLSICIPVPPAIPSAQRMLDLDHPAFDQPVWPFQRQVSLALESASRRALAAANEVMHGHGDIESFRGSAKDGLSANLCEALVGMAGEDARSFSIEFSWAVTRPVDARPALRFDSDHIQIIRSAAAELRKSEPEEDLHITGSVVRLHRDGTMGPGEISILGIVEGDVDSRFRRVWLSLVEEDYNLAMRAHQDGSLVSVRGNLRRRGNRSALENAYGFAVLSGDE